MPLLIGFFSVCLTGMPFRGPDAPVAIIALLFGMAAMGAQSALVRLLLRGVASPTHATAMPTKRRVLLAIKVEGSSAAGLNEGLALPN